MRYLASSQPLVLPSTLCLAALAAGCIMPNPPPSQSLAKFVRDPPSQAGAGAPGSRGRISFGSGVAFYESKAREPDEEPMVGNFYLFPVEGSLSLFLGERYDLGFSVSSSLLLGVDGNLALLATPRIRLGLLHGVGLGLTGCVINCRDETTSEKWGGMLAYNVSLGLMSQIEVARTGAFFMGARYAFASHAELGYGEDDSKDNWTQYVTASLGFMFRLGWLRVVPELILTYGSWRYIETWDAPNYVTRRLDIWIIVPTVTFGAGF